MIDGDGRSHSRSAYCNQILAISPRAARAALLLASPPDPAGRWPVLLLPRGALAVFGGRAPEATPAAPLWVADGELRAGRRRFAVELELHAWSDERCELGVRPAGRGRPPAWYFDLVGQAVTRMHRELIGLTAVSARPAEVAWAHPAGTALRQGG